MSGTVVNLGGNVIFNWDVATKEGEWYDHSSIDHLSATYKGKTGKVIAIQLNKLKRREQTRNALGEVVSDDATVQPYFDVVVRFADGALAMTTGYRIMSDTFELESVAKALAGEMVKELPFLVGKTFYAVGFSKLYQLDTSLLELSGLPNILKVKELPATNIPRLVPMPILAAKYLDATGVVFKLKLPNGTEALGFTPAIHYQENADKPFLAKVSGSLLFEIPSDLTQKDIDAIQHGTVSKGMKRETVYYVAGFPDKEENTGAGGKVLDYYDAHLAVFLDANGTVREVGTYSIS